MKKMSEKPEVKDDKNADIIDVNVALAMAERDDALDKLTKALDKIVELEQKLANAEALIEEDSKAALVNKISPRTSVSKAILSKMTVDELMKWDKVLDTAMPAFKSGAPLADVKKTNERQELDSMHSKYMSKLMGGS
jgi:hypothetical protein